MHDHPSLRDTPELPPSLISSRALVFDLFLVSVFFYFMFGVIKGHVPFEKEDLKLYATAYATACVSGVFWIALQCLRVTWKDQYQRSRS